MELKTYFSALTVAEREEFAANCKSTRGHLQNVAYGYRVASAELAVAIEQRSHGKVTRREMFPGTFASIWPELEVPSVVGAQHA